MNPPTPRRRISRNILIAVAATSLLAIAAMAAAYGFGWILAERTNTPPAAAPSTSALSAETQMECAAIRHEFSAWNQRMPRLVTVVTADNPSDVVGFELDGLKTAGDAMLKAASGYQDQPSKALAVAVANYNVDLGFVRLEHQLSGGTFSPDKKEKAVHSAGEVQAAYKTFMQSTCGEKV